MRIGILLLALLSLASCVESKPKIVYVPIAANCPTPILPAKPKLASGSLKPNDEVAVVQKALVADLKSCTSYADNLKTVCSP